MNFLELVQKRYSVRGYASTPIEQSKIDYIIECARLAPSACNRQPWKLILLEKQRLRDFAPVYSRDWFAEAPLAIVVCADHGTSWKRPADGKDHSDVDASIITEHIVLAATEQGLGTCWICNFDVEFCRSFLALPPEWEPVSIIPVGYARCEERPKVRKAPDEIMEIL